MAKNKNKNLAVKPGEGLTQPEAIGADQSVPPLSSEEEQPEHEPSFGEMMQRKPRKDYRKILQQKREERQNYARQFQTEVDPGTETGAGESGSLEEGGSPETE